MDGCGGLTLSVCQVPTKLSYPSPQKDRGRKCDGKAHGLKGQGDYSPLTSQVKQTHLGKKINLLSLNNRV